MTNYSRRESYLKARQLPMLLLRLGPNTLSSAPSSTLLGFLVANTTKVAISTAKREVEDYIRALPIKSAFFAPGSFMQNFSSNMKPHPVGDGTYALANIVAPGTRMPLINIEETGKYVAAILANPDEFEGKILAGATQLYTMEEIVGIMSKSSRKTVVYKQLPEDVFRSFLPPDMADYLVHMLLCIQDFGYYGAETEELVARSAANARGTLTTLEKYFVEHPLGLE